MCTRAIIGHHIFENLIKALLFNMFSLIEVQHWDGSRRVSLLWETQTRLMTEQVMWMNVLEKQNGWAISP